MSSDAPMGDATDPFMRNVRCLWCASVGCFPYAFTTIGDAMFRCWEKGRDVPFGGCPVTDSQWSGRAVAVFGETSPFVRAYTDACSDARGVTLIAESCAVVAVVAMGVPLCLVVSTICGV
jgi:hypothetical protein